MLIDKELEELLAHGEMIEPIQMPIEVGLLKKEGEKHLVAFVGGTPVFHSTYPSNAESLRVRAGLNTSRGIFGALFSTPSVI